MLVNQFGAKIPAADGGSGAYLLRTDFTGVSQPLVVSNGDVLDTAGEGVLDGQLTAIETSTSTITIDNDHIEFEVGSSVWHVTGFYSQAISRINGRTCQTNINVVGGASLSAIMFGFGTGTSISFSDCLSFAYFSQSNLVCFASGASEGNMAAGYSYSTDYIMTEVLDTVNSRSFYYIKGGAFTEQTLVHVGAIAADTDLNYAINYRGGTKTSMWDIKVPEDAYTSVITTAIYDAWIAGGSNPYTNAAFSVLDSI